MHSGNLLGKGSFGNVFESKDGKKAIKIVKNDSTGISNLLEISIMKTIKHPNINYATKISQDDDNVYIEQNKGDCDMFNYIKKNKIHVDTLKKLYYSLIHGLACLHKQEIIHSDIKSSNILVYIKNSEIDVKITDFSVSLKKWYKNETFTHSSGTSNYRPPESIMNKDWDEKVDIWSTGCLFYYMYYRVHLFPVQERKNRNKRIINCMGDWEEKIFNVRTLPKYDLEYIPPNISRSFFITKNRDFNDMIIPMLSINPEKRPSSFDLIKSPYLCNSRKKKNHILIISESRNISSQEVIEIDNILKPFKCDDKILTRTIDLYRKLHYHGLSLEEKIYTCLYISCKLFNHDIFKLPKIINKYNIVELEKIICEHLSYRVHL